MEADFWHNCWEKDHIGFHQDELHPLMCALFPQFLQRFDGIAGGILAPLCGKSLDMHYLATHRAVLGVELSDKACQDFFVEAQQKPERSSCERFNRYRGKGAVPVELEQSAAGVGELDKDDLQPKSVASGHSITLWAGDFFSLTAKDVAACPIIYDRAALIALPEQMQARYVSHLRAIAPKGAQLFLLTLEYPKDAIAGPPFCIDQQTVSALFAGCTIEKWQTLDLPEGKFARRSFYVSWMRETCYVITL